jgi:tRNA (uracil-5-)-methyltransferase TRM9
MNASTASALNRINRRFYAEIADAFSATRRDPWPGWKRAIEAMQAVNGSGPRVLDVGCGNGRFASYLETEWGPEFDYLGIDSSDALLEHARMAHDGKPRVALERFDFLPDTGAIETPDGEFDLVVLFGVLHHVPAHRNRRMLLTKLTERLAPGGLLVVAAWQFASAPRYRDRILTWEQYNENAPEPIDLNELEKGDFLLGWADSPSPRYCHGVDSKEMDRLLADLPTDPVCRFTADGKTDDLNLYAVERRQP